MLPSNNRPYYEKSTSTPAARCWKSCRGATCWDSSSNRCFHWQMSSLLGQMLSVNPKSRNKKNNNLQTQHIPKGKKSRHLLTFRYLDDHVTYENLPKNTIIRSTTINHNQPLLVNLPKNMFRKIKHTLHRKKTLDEFNQRIQLVVKPSPRFEAGT